MNHRRARRLLVAGALVTVIAGLYLFWSDRPIPIQSYRMLDDRTLALAVDDGSAWDRIESLTETDLAVTVTVRSLIIPSLSAPGRGGGTIDVTAKLARPLGNRLVIDGCQRAALLVACYPWLSGCPTLPPMEPSAP